MPEESKTLIMKFGGAALHSPQNFSYIADVIIKRSFHFPRIAIVVSAMGGMTDQLIKMAQEVHPQPPRREYDMLVSAGERISISLLAMALAAKGKEAVSFTGSQSGIITSSQHTEAQIIDVRPHRLLSVLGNKFVIVAGFQGVSHEKEITTLGRGGSDTTAVALGIALKAEKVEFYKDVAGIFQCDPKINQTKDLPYPKLTYSEAMEVVCQTGGRVLHPRAINLAKKNALPLHVRSFHDMEGDGTWIESNHPHPIESQYEI